jgi:hypothetical protein
MRDMKVKRISRRMVREIDAWILRSNGQRTECKIIDLSVNGARLVVPRASTLPRMFNLSWNAAPSGKTCELVWRNGSMTGVKFLD